MTTENKSASPTSEELAALIDADRQARVQAALADIRAVCDKYRVRLVGIAQIVGTAVETNVRVEAE